MKSQIRVYLLVLLAFLPPVIRLQAQGTAFTYQGLLNSSGTAANGSFDLRFALYDAVSCGTEQGDALTNSATAVSNGQFTVTLDFGDQFSGANRWLEIAVRPNGDGNFIILAPRQPITPSPYAMHAGGVDANAIAGTYGNAVNFSNPSNSFAGDGSELVALNAAALAAGTVDAARLPSAISSDTTGHAATADRVTGASTNTGKVFRVSDPANFKNSHAVLDRGGLYLASLIQADQDPNANWRGGIHFMDQTWDGSVANTGIEGPQLAAIQVYTNWSNPFQVFPTLHQWSRGAIRLENGFANVDSWGAVDNYLNLGNEDSNGRIMVTYVSAAFLSNYTTMSPIAPGRIGYSQPLIFDAISSDDTAGLYQAYPGIQGFAPSNTGGVAGAHGIIYPGELAFHSRVPSPNTTNAAYDMQYPDFKKTMGWMRTNGWQFFGRQLGSHREIVASNSFIALDFMGDYAQTILPTCRTNTFYAINVNTYCGTTNYEAKIFQIKSGGATRHFIWPEEWIVVGTSAEQRVLPEAIEPHTLLILRLEAAGVDNNTNLIARWKSGTYSPVYDDNAATFLAAAAITSPLQKAAVNHLVTDLKVEGLWTNLAVLYPFVGGTSNAHSMNLINPAQYGIVFTAAGVTHDANGITGNGTSGYGDTGFSLAKMGNAAISNCSIMVYNRVTTPTDGGAFLGTFIAPGGVPLTGFSLSRNGPNLAAYGLCNNSAPINFQGVSADFRGFLGAGRHPAEANGIVNLSATRLGGSTISTGPTKLATNNIYVLAHNQSNAGGPHLYSNANLAFAAVGWGFTSDQLLRLRDIVDTYQTLLGRNVIGPVDGFAETAPAEVLETGATQAAIQGLNQKLDQKETEITRLQQRLATLEQLVSRLNKYHE